MKNEKNYMGFLMSKLWQILKHLSGTFHRAKTLKLWGVNFVYYGIPPYAFIIIGIEMCKCSRTHICSSIWSFHGITTSNSHVPKNHSTSRFFLPLDFKSTWKKRELKINPYNSDNWIGAARWLRDCHFHSFFGSN